MKRSLNDSLHPTRTFAVATLYELGNLGCDARPVDGAFIGELTAAFVAGVVLSAAKLVLPEAD